MSPPRQIARVLAALLVAAALVGLASAGHDALMPPVEAGPRLLGSQSAQGQAPPQQPTFRTEANYVRVDVYATADGVPVADLEQEDFEVIEDGASQRIDAFERVVIRGGAPQETRREPTTVAESRAMVENSRARVFVLFLDFNQVEKEASFNIRQPLIAALNRLIAPDDLIGVMTPEMSAADVTFARRTTTIEGILSRFPFWGERASANPIDPRQQMYAQCYPGFGPTQTCPDDDRGVADELIQRHREKQTLDALGDLTVFLRGVREERKAIVAITDGWRLFKPNPALTRRLNCAMPQARVGIDPRTGKLSTAAPPGGSPSTDQCDSDRAVLAQIDSEEQLRRITDQANRANASFYPIDPRGLAVFDTSIAEPRIGARAPGTPSITPPRVDAQMLQSRANSLRDLAFSTDGMAIIGTNNLDAGLKRVTDDLSSYYLVGYYSTGRLDGKFHAIRVRVKRPGVQVRARRGYLAPTVAEVTASATRSAPVPPATAAAMAEARAIDRVLAPLNLFAREVPLRLQGVAGWMPNDTASIALVGEIGSSDEWKAGADADVMLTDAAGETLASGRATVAAGTRGFRLMLAPSSPLAPGEYTVRVRARGRSTTAAVANEVLRVTLPASPAASGAMFIRRGPATGNRDVPTADLRFRRNEQLRVELPSTYEPAGNARLLDRAGKPIAVPVPAAVRSDADGSRWQTAQLSLAPLAAGDYMIEVSEGTTRTLVAFRIVQ